MVGFGLTDAASVPRDLGAADFTEPDPWILVTLPLAALILSTGLGGGGALGFAALGGDLTTESCFRAIIPANLFFASSAIRNYAPMKSDFSR